MSDILARYTFLPHLRKGLSNKIEEQDNLNDFSTTPDGGWNEGRPDFTVKVNIEATKDGNTTDDHVTQEVQLVGPGDIIGIDQRLVVKTEPKNWITNYEPNYFPYIELYDEAFLWAYSPTSVNGRKLRPWLTLIALKEDEFQKDELLLGPLPSILVTGSSQDAEGTSGASSSIFPDPGQLWAWAHVHLNADVDPSNNLDAGDSGDLNNALNRFRSILAANPDQGVSRLICPRVLEPNTTYHCFLIPTFETGRLAGLGADAAVIGSHRAQEASYGADHSSDENHALYVDHYPYYYTWQFMTGDVGDFETLVRKLVPREVDRRVGRRPMDVQEPGYNVSFNVPTSAEVPQDGAVELEGALLPPNSGDERKPYEIELEADNPIYTYRKRLADLVNLGEDLLEATFPPDSFYGTNPFGYTDQESSITDDPIIGPELYGRWHALRKRLDTTNGADGAIGQDPTWLYEMNLDPRSRAVAGLGVEHIKQNQEKLMDRAWEQMGEVLEANRRLKWGQLAQRVSIASYGKHLEPQSEDLRTAMLGSMYKKVKIGNVTAYKELADSVLPQAVQSYGFRKIERPSGPVMRRINASNSSFSQNELRHSLANKTIAPVQEKFFGSQIGVAPNQNLQSDVARISNYNVSTARYSPAQPESVEIEPNLEAEVRFQTAVSRYNDYFHSVNWQGVTVKPSVNLGSISNQVLQKLHPRFTLPKSIYDRIRFSRPTYEIPPADKIIPVMAYPVFPEPTYESVRDLGVDYLIPNLDLVPNNTITLLESNQRFIEAFLMGANHEMGRELLWREFLTDQRGSYFRQFWDSVDQVNVDGLTEEQLAESGLDITEIHKWETDTNLGEHNARPGVDDPALLVLMIRGDLLKKYPDTIVYAQKARFKQAGDEGFIEGEYDPKVDPRTLTGNKMYPLFSANIDPDITFFGFDLTADEARGNRPDDPGYFFVLHERPGEIRFGLDAEGTSGTPPNWNDINQNNAPITGHHVDASNNAITATDNTVNDKPVTWGDNSTNFAQILFQNPVLLAVHGDEMIP